MSVVDQETDAERLRQVADNLDAALDAIEYVVSGELDDSVNPVAAHAAAAHLMERVRRLDAAVHQLDSGTRDHPRGPGKTIGMDGKWYPRYTNVDGEVIRSLRDTGLSIRAIADKLGCSVGSVHRHLSSHVQVTHLTHLND